MTVHRVVGNVIVEHTQISNGASIGYHFSETWQSTISAASVHWGKKKNLNCHADGFIFGLEHTSD